MKYIFRLILTIYIMSLLFTFNAYGSTLRLSPDEIPQKNTPYNYKKLEELLQELKEERKIIEQQKLEEIEQKRLEKEKNNLESPSTEVKIPTEIPKDNETKANDNIPKLIVRLRGKHSSKYLCSYKLLIQDDRNERELSKESIVDYSTLLKKPSLKVRPGEVINFEFTPKSKEIKAYILNDSSLESINVKRGCISVPNLDKKIVVLVDGIFNNGYIRYAIVLDIRSA